MNTLAEKLEEIQAALEIGQTAITELHKENGELKEKLQAFEMLESQDIDKELQRLTQENRALKDNPKASANWQMVLSAVNANRKANELETARDEWKRRALEAEESLQKAADIFGKMAQCGAIGTETDPMGYYVPEELLSAIYAPLQNVSQSGKNATA